MKTLALLALLPVSVWAQPVYTMDTLPKSPNGFFICGNNLSTTPCIYPIPVSNVATCPVRMPNSELAFMPCPPHPNKGETK